MQIEKNKLETVKTKLSTILQKKSSRSQGVCFNDNRSKKSIEKGFLAHKDVIQNKSFHENENRNKKSWFIDKSPIHGKGVMAGKSLNREEELGKVASLNKNGVDITSDFGSLINHQSDKKANASLEKEGNNFILKMNKSIDVGEEITTDYDNADPYFEKSKSTYKKI
ncbi:hypothetical protein DS884_16035 [Tenacibaculum sp. E3R01]|uniref:SET domain-containing protein-lysine N-methyltransferase n=1 Tax=Tenacibaculum sp. E3R01 TaxID=2267227 RepID=UPI000DEA31F9|nr:SET domain-containing protein-lysine N-methyltransferase [Tenacibaculum sp. E3R01]RBW55857.1 hypothetical protein DS884_16035 [Tenacibaculum sp. E3R01]